MHIDASRNVLMLATGYVTGYGLCLRHSSVQWLFRASLLVLAMVMYVVSDRTSYYPDELIPLLTIDVLVDVCDYHADGISVLKRTMTTALIARLHGAVQEIWWFATMYAGGFAILHHVSSKPVPAANALVMYVSLTMPHPARPFEAFVRLLGACVVMYLYRHAAIPLQSYSVAHFFMAPWPVACIIGVMQISAKCYATHDGHRGPETHAVLV